MGRDSSNKTMKKDKSEQEHFSKGKTLKIAVRKLIVLRKGNSGKEQTEQIKSKKNTKTDNSKKASEKGNHGKDNSEKDSSEKGQISEKRQTGRAVLKMNMRKRDNLKKGKDE